MMRLKPIWVLAQTTVAVDDNGGKFPDTPETWAAVVQGRLDGTMVTLVDVSDAMAATLRSTDDDRGPMGDVAFRVTHPGDMDLPTFRVPTDEGSVDDLLNGPHGWGDWADLVSAMDLLGVSRDVFLRLPVTLALQVAQLTLGLAKLKSQGQEALIPVGFTVGPIYWDRGETNG